MWNFIKLCGPVSIKAKQFCSCFFSFLFLAALLKDASEEAGACMQTSWRIYKHKTHAYPEYINRMISWAWWDETKRCTESGITGNKRMQWWSCRAGYCFHLVAEWEEPAAPQLSLWAFDLFSNRAGTQGFWPLALRDWMGCQLHTVSISPCIKSLSAAARCVHASSCPFLKG